LFFSNCHRYRNTGKFVGPELVRVRRNRTAGGGNDYYWSSKLEAPIEFFIFKYKKKGFRVLKWTDLGLQVYSWKIQFNRKMKIKVLPIKIFMILK
jgi:hypothetical protein